MRRAESRDSQGFFAARTNWNLESNRLGEVLAGHRALGKPLLDLTESNPTRCGFGYDEDTLLRALANRNSLIYQPNAQGLLSARRAVVQYYAERGESVSAGDLLLTTGTSEAYSFVFRLLCNPGDQILVPSPSYPLFDFLADLQDVKVVRYPLQYDYGWEIDFDTLERSITPATRALIVVNPNNPTGNFCSRVEEKRLGEICARHKLALIADEVFLDFVLGEDSGKAGDVSSPGQPRSLVSNEQNLTFAMSGISKICGLPQMKLAWLATIGPAELKAEALARLELIADTYLSMNAPVQHAAAALLAGRPAFHQQVMKRVRENLADLDRQLNEQRVCSRLPLQGGWYAVVRVPQDRTDEEVAIALLERKNVYVHPGHFYDFPSEGHLVVSLIADAAEFAAGIASLLSLFD